MEEIDLAAANPKPLIGWSLKAGARGELVLYLEYVCSGEGSGSLTLAIPSASHPSARRRTGAMDCTVLTRFRDNRHGDSGLRVAWRVCTGMQAVDKRYEVVVLSGEVAGQGYLELRICGHPMLLGMHTRLIDRGRVKVVAGEC